MSQLKTCPNCKGALDSNGKCLACGTVTELKLSAEDGQVLNKMPQELIDALNNAPEEYAVSYSDIEKAQSRVLGNLKSCLLVKHCPNKTATCSVMEPDDGCYYYRYFKKLIEKEGRTEIEPDMDRCHFINSTYYIDADEHINWYIYNNVKIKEITKYLPWRYEVIYDNKSYVFLSLEQACKFIENHITLQGE